MLLKYVSTYFILMKLFFFFSCRTLNFNNHPLYIGGLKSIDPLLESPGQVKSDDFVGCVHSVTINGRSLNLSNALSSHNVQPECNRGSNPCNGNLETNTIQSEQCGIGQCIDLWSRVGCTCDGLYSPDCLNSLEPVTLSEGGFVEFTISDKHRRMHLLDFVYKGASYWTLPAYERSKRYSLPDISKASGNSVASSPGKSIGLTFRSNRKHGLLLYVATNKDFTSIEVHILLY